MWNTNGAIRCMTALRCRAQIVLIWHATASQNNAARTAAAGTACNPTGIERCKALSLRHLRRSRSRCLAMLSPLVCGCGTPLTQPARTKTAYVQLKLPRTVSGLQRRTALAGRKSSSSNKRSRNEPLFVSCAASPGALSPEDQGGSTCYCCTSIFVDEHNPTRRPCLQPSMNKLTKQPGC